MGHHAIFDARFTTYRGKLVVVVKATYKKHSRDVFRMVDGGKAYARNLLFCPMAGYTVDFPEYMEKWAEAVKPCRGLMETDILEDDDKATIVAAYPEFRWVLKKAPFLSVMETWDALQLWKEHPKEVELLMAAGFKRLALSKSLHSANKKRQRLVLDFVRHNPDRTDVGMKEIETRARYGLDAEQYNEFTEWQRRHYVRVSYPAYKWITANNIPYAEYLGDYLPACKEVGKDLTDRYWLYPNDYRARHDLVIEQLNAKREAEAMIRREEERKRRCRELVKFRKVVKEWSGRKLVRNGYECRPVACFAEMKNQAETLHQCLISCKYWKKIAAKECLLLFIFKNGKPSSTAQVMPDGKIYQFYGDEHSSNIHPSDAERELAAAWIHKYYRTKKQREAA